MEENPPSTPVPPPHPEFPPAPAPSEEVPRAESQLPPPQHELPPPQPPPQPVPPHIPISPGVSFGNGAPFSDKSKDERLWAAMMHIAGLVGSTIGALTFIPANLLLPLILWLIKRDSSLFVNDQGKEAINFQINITIIAALCVVSCIGVFLLPLLGLYALIIGIIAAIKANEGVTYRYPATLRLLS